MNEIPHVRIPTGEEIGHNVSDSIELRERVSYVLELLEPARLLGRAVENLQGDLHRRNQTIEGMRTELKALHEKMGDLPPGDRAAVDARYEMLGQITKARSVLEHWADRAERDLRDAVGEMRQALRKPS